MKTITFITSNINKLTEVKEVLDNNHLFQLVHRFLELPELQAPSEEIAINKCMTATAIVQGPVLIEDTAICCNSLNGLPGPYIKAFLTHIGVEGLVRILANFEDKTAYSTCTFAYTEGPNKEVHLFTGTTEGSIVKPLQFTAEMHGNHIFQPKGYNITYARMNTEDKNKVSPRYKALTLVKEFLTKK